MSEPDISVVGDDNLIEGGSTSDWIVAVGDRNRLRGRDGNDELIAEGDDNIVDGGPGNDRLNASGNGVSLIGGRGHDVLHASVEVMTDATSSVVVSTRLDGEAGDDELTAIATATVPENDHIVSATNILSGGGGNDELTALAEASTSGPGSVVVTAMNDLNGAVATMFSSPRRRLVSPTPPPSP